MTHDELAEDLATHLRGATGGLIWTNMQMGPSGSPRPDVWWLPTTYSRFQPVSYEIKVSRSDFLRDVGTGKWQSYLAFSSGVIFACESGLIKVNELPPGTGLIERSAAIWRHKKRPAMRHVENLPIEVWLKLVMDGVDRAHAGARAARSNEWLLEERLKQKLGADVAAYVRDAKQALLRLEWVKEDIQRRQQSADASEKERREAFEAELREKLDPPLVELAKLLGIADLDPRNLWPLVHRVRDAKRALVVDERLTLARQYLNRAADSVSQAMSHVAVDASGDDL